MPRTALRTVGRPSSRSVIDRAHDLPPIVSVVHLAVEVGAEEPLQAGLVAQAEMGRQAKSESGHIR